MLYSKFNFLPFVLVLFLMAACNNSTSPDEQNNFDRPAMLENYGGNIIIPAFEDMQAAAEDLQSAANNFENDPTVDQLQNLQAALKEARLAWQNISPFQFGPAETVALRASLNKYPTDTSKIEANIKSGDYILGTSENMVAGGFPALGYLLHGVDDSNEDILAMYTGDANAQNRMTYLLDNISFIKDLVDTATNEWQSSGGDYIGMFLSDENAGTDVGSSLGMLINSYVMHYERFLRDGKVGIPAGVSSAGIPRPTSTEAYYGGYSLELAKANLNQVERIFTGGKGTGLDDNLDALDAGDLSDEIQTQIDEAQSALEQLSDPLSQQIEDNNDLVLDSFEKLHAIVSLLKADMTSVLGITITYQDSDGD